MIVKAPHPIPDSGKAVFLAGSIEQGKAEDWQAWAIKELAGVCHVLSPRRDDWDPSWVQSIHNHQFREQVEWELKALERADAILMHFDPATKSPISLLELGLFARSGKLVVHCPEGFWRKGNVDIVCSWYGIKASTDWNDALSLVTTMLARE